MSPKDTPVSSKEFARRVVESYLQEGDVYFGWARKGVVVTANYTEGEDNHHICQDDWIPHDQQGEWKRWRYNEELGTAFWWEAPSQQERDALSDEFGRIRHVYVELNSSPHGDRAKAGRLMPTANLTALEQSGDPVKARAGADLLDVVHYPDRDTSYVDRWLDTVGD